MLELMFISVLIFMVVFLFFILGKKGKIDFLSMSVFECGFTSYFFSRFSFSLHYFSVGMIFLFLDLELCYLMPFFNQDFSSSLIMIYSWLFVFILISGLVEEWGVGLLDWKF